MGMRRSDLFDEEERRRNEYVDLPEAGQDEMDPAVAVAAQVPVMDPESANWAELLRSGQETKSEYTPGETEMAAEPASAYKLLTASPGEVPEEPPGVHSPQAGKPTPAPEEEGTGGSGLSIPDPMDPNKSDRVSQALYHAFMRKPLSEKFFDQPNQDRKDAASLAEKKNHLDLMKASLRARYAGKGVSTDPTDADAASPNSQNYRALIRNTTVGKRFAEGNANFDAMSKAELAPTFDKYIVNNETKLAVDSAKDPRQAAGIEQRGVQSRLTEGAKQGGRVDLQEDKQKYDAEKTAYTQGEQSKRSQMAIDAARARFDEGMDLKKDAMAYQVSSKIPSGAKAVYDAGARIDTLITQLGGEGNLEGVGFLEGGIPTGIYEKPVIALRHEINELVNTWNHEKFGGSFTTDEMKRADAAVPGVKAMRSEAEVLDGMRLIRSIMQSKVDQAVGGAAPEIKRRLFKYYSQGAGGAHLFGPPADGPAAPDAALAPAPAESLDTTTQLEEPSPEQLNDLATSPTPKEIRVKPPQPKAPAPVKKPAQPQMSPKGLPYARSVVSKGRRYFIDKANKIIDWMPEPANGP